MTSHALSELGELPSALRRVLTIRFAVWDQITGAAGRPTTD
ncbi:hypothetical protein ABZ656_55265 [Streptomyces sp. NPDC007095]|jgi:hypothetical protein